MRRQPMPPSYFTGCTMIEAKIQLTASRAEGPTEQER